MILTIIYIIMIAIIGGMIVWNMFTDKNIYNKIMGCVMLIMILLRIFLIK